MKPKDVRKRVEKIRQMAGDDEMAHGEEDRLWGDVLMAIANGAPKAKKLAQEALKTLDIEFYRWCA